MHDRPEYLIGPPRLLQRRALVERLVDVRSEVRRRADLRHHARLLLDRAELELCQIIGVALLLVGAEQAIVAERHSHYSGVEGVRLLRLPLISAGIAPRATLDV